MNCSLSKNSMIQIIPGGVEVVIISDWDVDDSVLMPKQLVALLSHKKYLCVEHFAYSNLTSLDFEIDKQMSLSFNFAAWFGLEWYSLENFSVFVSLPTHTENSEDS